MSWEKEYLDEVVSRIQCAPARELVRRELGDHIADQKEAYMAMGESEDAAERQAVRQMGDPAAAGEVGWTLFLPVFVGFVYRFRREQSLGLAKTVGIMLLQSAAAAYLGMSVYYAVAAVCLVVVFGAVTRRIYGGNRRAQLTVCFAAFAGIPALSFLGTLVTGGDLSYQMRKILAIFLPGEFADSFTSQFLEAREQVASSAWLGSGDPGMFLGTEQSYTNFMLTGVAASFGWIAALALVAVLVCFAARMLKVFLLQTNQMGFLLGLAVSSLFFLKVGCYVLQNLGILYSAITTELPFVSYGPHNTLLNFALLGLLLSVYRGTMIYGEAEKKGPVYRIRLEKI